MAGKLTIHSSGSGEVKSGHSWIEYTPDGGASTTYGTWGNDPTRNGTNGLFENLESGRSGDASRTARIDDAQEKKLLAKIQQYRDKGNDGWGYLNPCSGFAADAWKTTTGETISHRSGIISNPSKLKNSILKANAGSPAAASTPKPTPSRPQSSRRRCGSSVQPCPLKGTG